MKVRALTTVIYVDANMRSVRMRGDDTLGDGNGVVFELVPRVDYEYDVKNSRTVLDKETGQPIPKMITAEQQFSPITMIRVDDDTPETYVSAQDALTMQNDSLSPVRSRKKRAG